MSSEKVSFGEESCPRCMKVVPVHVQPNGPHLGVYCDQYGHWIRWIPKKDAEDYKKYSFRDRWIKKHGTGP